MKKTQKRPNKAAPTGLPSRWQEEQKRLRKEIKQLKAERDQYKKSLVALMHEDIPINRKELLAQVGKRPLLQDLISELEAQGV